MAVNHATVQAGVRASLRAVAMHLDSVRELNPVGQVYIFSDSKCVVLSL